MVEMKNAYYILLGSSERTRPLRRPKLRWEDNTEWILEEEGGKLWSGFICLRIGTSGRLF
jgi:hypothetical protein